MRAKYHLPLLLFLAGSLFLINLGGYDLWPPDEPRFAQVAREMLMTADYLVPRINGQPYTEKPPMLFWLTALASAPSGDVTEFSARIPLAMAGILTILLTYLLARSLYGTRVAFWTALMLLTTHRFWWQARFGQIDMLMTMFLTAALLCFWSWHQRRSMAALASFYLAIAAAVLTKGPPGLVFPLFMAVAFYWNRKTDRKALHLVLGFTFVAVIVLAWLIPARMAISGEIGQEAGDSITSNLFRQTIGRFFLGVSHAKWPWFYITHAPVDLLPWSLFLPWTLPWVWKRQNEDEKMRMLLAWTVPAFVFFSICIGKRSIYLLPLYPVLAILMARSVLDLMDGVESRWRKNTVAVWGAILLLVAIAPWILLLSPYAEYWQDSLVLISACIGACGIHALYSSLRTSCRPILGVMAAHTVVILLLSATLIFPAINPHKSARAFCAPLNQLTENGSTYDLYSVGFSREEYIFYTRHFHTPAMCDLLAIPEMQNLPVRERAQLQSKMKRRIQKAVRDVPIASMAHVTDDELAALKAVVDLYEWPEEKQAAHLAGFEKATSGRLNQLFTAMDTPSPAFMFALEEDWRWILALSPEGRKYTLLSASRVGSRDVLLFANDAGKRLVKSNSSSTLASRLARSDVAVIPGTTDR